MPGPLPADSAIDIGAILAGAAIAAAVLVVAAAATPAAMYLRGTEDSGELRFRVPVSLSAQPEQVLFVDFSAPDVDVSPDGRRLAFVARATNQTRTAFRVRPSRQLGRSDAFRGIETHATILVRRRSLDWIRLWRQAQKVEASGGPPQDICPAADFVGGTWNGDDTIVFGTAQGLFRVSAEGGGAPEQLTILDAAESGHFWPHFFPMDATSLTLPGRRRPNVARFSPAAPLTPRIKPA